MSTINKSIAQTIISNNGFYPHDGEGPPDPQAWVVFTYRNQWNSAIAWAVAYSEEDFHRHGHCEDVQVKWMRQDIARIYRRETVH